MFYDQKLEVFEDRPFTRFDPCIWVVYDAGAAGDLLATLINMHYARTGSKFHGITPRGQIIFKPSDNKKSNQLFSKRNIKKDYWIDHETADVISYGVNDTLSEDSVNYSRTDQIIFSNHFNSDENVQSVLEYFPKAKVVRVVAKNNLQKKMIQWMAHFKNLGKISDITIEAEDLVDSHQSNVNDDRLLDIEFKHLFIHETFEQEYTRLISFLELPFKLVRYDLIEFWIDNQHSVIKDLITKHLRGLKEPA